MRQFSGVGSDERSRDQSSGLRRGISTEGWLAERAEHAALTLQHCVEVNPNKCSGVPVFRGTRFTLVRFLAELAEERSVTASRDSTSTKKS